ncbi:MAG TPA: sigma-70 family RNA polymerase sigma factor [Longimicrobiales bacterium]|nr:sigma-70 family RNA polymerase sigma factor [Longimicrobiales bacterium]
MTLERIRTGDVGALEELLRDAWAPLVRHLTLVLGSPEAAQDVAQEAFVRLWERRERWSAGSARALVFRIGRNAALDLGRRQAVRNRWAREGRPDPSPFAAGPDEELEAAELRRRVEAALGRMAPRRREVFELVRFAGLSYGEVGDAMELAPQTVANHMSLALRDLRAELSDLMGVDPGEVSGGRTNDG